MTMKRRVSVLAFPLVLALAAPPASAESSTETKPVTQDPIKVDSPNMVKSIRDWHPELKPQTAQSTETSKGGKTSARPAASMRATTATPFTAAQRPPQVSASGKPAERAQEVPLDSVKW